MANPHRGSRNGLSFSSRAHSIMIRHEAEALALGASAVEARVYAQDALGRMIMRAHKSGDSFATISKWLGINRRGHGYFTNRCKDNFLVKLCKNDR